MKGKGNAGFILGILALAISSPVLGEKPVCPGSCLQDKEVGTGTKSLPKWFFNYTSQKCQSFLFSGSDGNGNLFSSKNSCNNKCGPCKIVQDIHALAASNLQTCDCHFVPKLKNPGCIIAVPAPKGYKCKCIVKWWKFVCDGEALKCGADEDCPENCTSLECCRQGSGNCNGYSTKSKRAKIRSIRACLEKNQIPKNKVIDERSNGTFYKILNQQWNLRLTPVHPILYFIPSTTQDVQSAVICARQAQVPIAANSGGHSYEHLSFGTSESMIIDFRYMNRKSINKKELTARIEPGNLIGPMTQYLWDNGGYAISTGNCLTVGIGGHAIGGGEGYYVSKYGTALDNVLEVTVVTANGSAVVANPHQNQDLYWAFRGVGAGYFGIVTDFKFRLFEAGKINSTFVVVRYSHKDFAKVLYAYQEWTKWVDENDPTIMSGMFVTSDHKTTFVPPLLPGLQVQMMHVDDSRINSSFKSTNFLQKFREIFPPVPDANFNVTYPDFMSFMLDVGYSPMVYKGKPIVSVLQPGAPDVKILTKDIMALPRYHKGKTFFVKKRFDLATFEKIGQVMETMPHNTIWLMISPERGAILNLKPNETAYVHRNSIYQVCAHYEGTNPAEVEEGMQWLDEFWEAVQILDGGETYQNYPDLEVEDYLDRVYGSNLPKLMKIKRKWDSRHYFNQKWSIPLTKE